MGEKNDFYKNVPPRHAPIGDVANGHDVAESAYFLTYHSRNTTGAELVIDGGNSMQLYPIIQEK